ncbi:MAG: hypothetical protein J5J00_04730 [Deltaproteobacteria bacterium]|nr:hypothetical protein [Deltaproteobacteria bacterium]
MAKRYVIKDSRDKRNAGQYVMVPHRTFGVGSLAAGLGVLAFAPFRLVGGLFSMPARALAYAGSGRTGLFGSAGQLGNLLVICLLGFLLFNRSFLDYRFPGWEESVGVAGLMFALLALAASVFSCFRAVGMSFVYLLATFLIGKAVLYPSSSTYQNSKDTRQAGAMERLYGELEYFHLPEAASVSSSSGGFLSGLQKSVSDTGGAVSKFYDDVTGGFTRSVTGISSAVQNEMNSGLGSILTALNLESSTFSRNSMAINPGRLYSPSLPNSAYFGSPVKSRRFYPVGGSSNGMDGIIAQVRGVLSR